MPFYFFFDIILMFTSTLPTSHVVERLGNLDLAQSTKYLGRGEEEEEGGSLIHTSISLLLTSVLLFNSSTSPCYCLLKEYTR